MAQSAAQKPVRTLVLARSLMSGGAEKQAILLARVLDEMGGCRLVVLYDEVNERLRRLAKENDVEVTFLHGTLVRKVIELRSLVRSCATQVVMATLPVTCAVAGVVALLEKCRVVGGFRNEFERRRLRLFGLRILHNRVFRGTIANSRVGYEFLVAHGFRPQKILFVPNAIDGRERTRSMRLVPAPVTITTVARLTRQKNIPLALEVVRQLRHRGRQNGLDIRYQLVGYGIEEQSIEARVRDLGLTDCVQILRNNVDAEQVLSETDIYLSTSDWEGMSNSIMEAMAWGVPVVATGVGDTAALVQDGETGFLLPPGDLDGLVARTWALATDIELRTRLGRCAKSVIEDEFSLAKLKIRIRKALADIGLDVGRCSVRSTAGSPGTPAAEQ